MPDPIVHGWNRDSSWAFHMTMTALASIGKRVCDAWLQDCTRVIELGVVATGSVNGVMNGHHYNRSIRCHNEVMAEALLSIVCAAKVL